MSVNIKKIRKEQGLTQVALAEKIGVKQNTISAWENGESYPRVEVLIKLSEIFGCTLDELVRKS